MTSTRIALCRLRGVHRTTKLDASKSGLAQGPFSREVFRVKDGRQVSITNSAFGAVYMRTSNRAYPVCDDAGYAPLGDTRPDVVERLLRFHHPCGESTAVAPHILVARAKCQRR